MDKKAAYIGQSSPFSLFASFARGRKSAKNAREEKDAKEAKNAGERSAAKRIGEEREEKNEKYERERNEKRAKLARDIKEFKKEEIKEIEGVEEVEELEEIKKFNKFKNPEKFEKFEKFENVKSAEDCAAKKAKRLLPLVVYPLFAFITAAASPAMGVYPFGVSLVASAQSLHTALAALVGTIAAAFRMGRNSAVTYIIASCAVFTARLAAGSLGIIKTRRSPAGGEILKYKNRKTSGADTVGDRAFHEACLGIKNSFSSGVSPKLWTSLIAAAGVGFVGIITGGNLWYDVFAAALGLVFIPLFTFAFSAVLEDTFSPSLRKMGVMAGAYALFLALSPLTLGTMNIAAALGFLSSLYVGYSSGCYDGALYGLFVGMAQSPAFCAMYALGGAACGALSSFSVGAASVCSAFIAISWAIYADGIAAFSSVMPEILLAAAIFYPVVCFKVLPETINIIPSISSQSEKKRKRREETLAAGRSDGASYRLKKISDAMSHMAKIFEGLSERLRVPGSAESAAICEEVFSLSCIDCQRRKICHAREGFSNGAVIKKVSAALKERGRVSVGDFPEAMRRGCARIDSIAKEINGEYRKFFEDAVKSDRTSVIAKDYGDIAEMIRESISEGDAEWEKNDGATKRLSEELLKNGVVCEAVSVYGKRRPQIFIRGLSVKDLSYGTKDILCISERAVGIKLTEPEMSIDYDKLNMFMECRRRFDVKCGRFSEGAAYPEANGDVISAFSGERGETCMLICDGMGSGRDAALTARVSSVFLEKMLGAGCPVDTALELLNNFTRERRIECFSTVDLIKIDPYSGGASFVKSGAAPSFVLRKGRVFRIQTDTAPLGILRGVSAKSVSFELEAGDVVIMLSDGVLPGEDSLWFYELVSGSAASGIEPDEGARRIVEESRKHCRRPDDATVGIIKIDAA